MQWDYFGHLISLVGRVFAIGQGDHGSIEGDQKAPFSIATTPKCREGRYSFPWITPLYPWYVPYNAEC